MDRKMVRVAAFGGPDKSDFVGDVAVPGVGRALEEAHARGWGRASDGSRP